MSVVNASELRPSYRAQQARSGPSGDVSLEWPQFGRKGKCYGAESSRGLTRFGTLGYSATRISIEIFIHEGP